MRRFLAILAVSALMMVAATGLAAVPAPEGTTTTTSVQKTTVITEPPLTEPPLTKPPLTKPPVTKPPVTTTTAPTTTTTVTTPATTTTVTTPATTTTVTTPATTTTVTTPATTTTATTPATTTTTSIAIVGPPAVPPSGSGIRETATGVQADYSSELFGSMEMGEPEVLGTSFNADYKIAAEVIESSWVWMIGLLVVIAGAIVTGLDRRKTLDTPLDSKADDDLRSPGQSPDLPSL